ESCDHPAHSEGLLGMTGSTPDEDLAQALSSLSARSDDQAAWRRLFVNLWPFVVGAAWRRIRDRSGAEDVAQEVFVRLVQSRPFANVADVRQLRAYVWRMTINAANDHLKRNRYRTGHETAADAAMTEAVPDPAFLDDPMLYAEVLGLTRESLLPDEIRLLEL